MSDESLEAIARTTLYEGYLLWPYRRSAMKNQQRFTLGGVYPRGFCEEAREQDRWRIRCETLLEAAGAATVSVELRFLHLVHRQTLELTAHGLEPVDRLEAGGEVHLTWDEATERRHRLPECRLGELHGGRRQERIEIPSGLLEHDVRSARGEIVGALRRTWEAIAADVTIEGCRLRPDIHRVSVEAVNRSGWTGRARADAQRRSLLAAHLVLRSPDGAFLSLADPPEALAGAASACRNEGVWPVLVGDRRSQGTVLASPIILEDYPEIAPESPGDLFDGSEIDQLLILNILGLTDEEKVEMAATDARAREILERTAGLSRDELMRLHGRLAGPSRRSL